MGADIHMVLEKRILPPGMMPGNEVWVGVNAFPYVKATVYDFSRREKAVAAAAALDGTNAAAAAAEVEVMFTGRVSWSANSRNYSLFGALAGVRGRGPDPRGVPDDVSVLAAHEIANWDADGHSHSWMTMDEALPIFVKMGQFGDPGEAVVDAIRQGTSYALEKYMAHFWSMSEEDRLEDFRLVYWFDN